MDVVWMVLGAVLISGACCAVVFGLLVRAKDLPGERFGSRCELDSSVANGGCCPEACARCIYLKGE